MGRLRAPYRMGDAGWWQWGREMRPQAVSMRVSVGARHYD